MLRKEAKHIIVHIVFKHSDKDQEDQKETNLINWIKVKLWFLCGTIIEKSDK